MDDKRTIDDILLNLEKRDLTQEERREQQISYTMGMLGKKNTMSREQVQELIDKRYG